jgi:hypothetical protein
MGQLPFNLGNGESLGRKLIGATVGSAGVRLAGMAVTFLVGVQLARYLGPAGYGIYGSVMAVVTLLAVAARNLRPQKRARSEHSAAPARRAEWRSVPRRPDPRDGDSWPGSYMPELLKYVRSQFDVILIDTPPMLQIPDTRVVGRMA